MKIKKLLSRKQLIGLIIILVVVAIALIFVLGKNRVLNKPESVVWDAANSRYLISNSGNGSIAAMDMDGKLSIFMQDGMTSPKGMFISKPYLYVADINQIHAIDISSARLVASYPIEGAVMLNDIATDRNGHLYITDTGANSLFIFDPLSKGLQKITNPLLNSPNGIVYDRPRHQMLICGYSSLASILVFDIASGAVNIFKDTIYSNLDGIVIDDIGRIFFSSWKEKAIFMIPLEQNRFIQIAEKLRSPADMIYNPQSQELVIPLLESNKIHRHSIKDLK